MLTGWERIEFCSMTIAFVVLCFSFLILLQRRNSKLPPGPKALPFLGNLHQLDSKDVVRSLRELSHRYGPVFTIYLGPQPNVILYGYKTFKEALVEQDENFSGKGEFPAFYRFTQGNGKCICPGEGLAHMEIFIFLTTFLQHFKFKPKVNPDEIGLTPSLSGVGNVPADYQLIAVPC